MRAAHLARLVLGAQAKGVIEGWRGYIAQEQKQAGISNRELKAAIEEMREKK